MNNKFWLFIVGVVTFIVVTTILIVATNNPPAETAYTPVDIAAQDISGQGVPGTEEMFTILGKAACTTFSIEGTSQATEFGIIDGTVTSAQRDFNVTLTMQQAGIIIGAEVPVFCPQFTEEVINNGK